MAPLSSPGSCWFGVVVSPAVLASGGGLVRGFVCWCWLSAFGFFVARGFLACSRACAFAVHVSVRTQLLVVFEF